MGVFGFIREAGAKVGIGDSKEEKQARAASASAERAADMAKRIRERKAAAAKAERMEKFDETKKAWGLETYVKELGIEIEDLDIRYDDGTATITGTAKSREEREKASLAVGNVEGVGTVQDDISVSEESEESNMRVVVAGDTLSSQGVLWRRHEVSGHLRGQPADAEGPRQDRPRQDLCRPGPPDPRAGVAVGSGSNV